MSLTAERLREVLDYDPETGIFTWSLTPRSGITAGGVAGTPNALGYIVIRIDRGRYQAHRLAWLYVTGVWPTAEIDHKNCTSNDNRFANLREAGRSQNIANSRRRSDNTSGFKGVTFHKASGKWHAKIWKDQKEISLRYYNTPEEAHAAYVAAATQLQGEFARSA